MERFCGVHEIFWAYIDGPWNIFQNIWWVTKYSLMFYFRNSFKLRELEHKISKPAIKEIYERQDMLNKSHPISRYKVIFSNLYLFYSIFSIMFWLIGCMILMKEYVFLTTAAMKMSKRHFTVIIATVAKRKRYFIG